MVAAGLTHLKEKTLKERYRRLPCGVSPQNKVHLYTHEGEIDAAEWDARGQERRNTPKEHRNTTQDHRNTTQEHRKTTQEHHTGTPQEHHTGRQTRHTVRKW